MSFTPEPGTPLATYYAQTKPRIGRARTAQPRHARRGDHRPLRDDDRRHGPEPLRPGGGTGGRLRRRRGPPNLLAAIVEWGIGTPEAQLQPDGTPADGVPLGDADLRLRVMGAGEGMELVNPPRAPNWCSRRPSRRITPNRPAPAPACSSPPSTPSHPPTAPSSTATDAPSYSATPPRSRNVAPSRVGDLLPPLRHTATTFQLFRYSAVTWNPHRIHFDETYARERAAVSRCTPTCGRRSPCAASPRASARGGRSRRSPTACASRSTRRPRPSRPGHRGRRRQPDPRAHRGEPLRRGRARGHGVGQQDHGRDRRRAARVDNSTMTTAAGRRRRPIRIGNCSGFYGDRASAMADMARGRHRRPDR